ncbi:MAG: hypothetical protein KGI24_00090 [Candidatus Omnitrophica bacterium]|nr:hypothetical protein [Candidatus Omnitrophota bacterium]
MPKKSLKKPLKKCCMCTRRPVFSIKTVYCRFCSYFSARISNERFPPGVREKLVDYVRRYDFTCAYTGMPLDVFDYKSPRFLEFDHVTPGDPHDVVITSSWVNEMKADQTFKEFRRSIRRLYLNFMKGIKIKNIKLAHWFRLCPPLISKRKSLHLP